MDAFIYISAAGVLIGGGIIWFVNRDAIGNWVKTGPKQPSEIAADKIRGLAHRVDAMMAAKNIALQHAEILEREIAETRADLAAATGKLIP